MTILQRLGLLVPHSGMFESDLIAQGQVANQDRELTYALLLSLSGLPELPIAIKKQKGPWSVRVCEPSCSAVPQNCRTACSASRCES